MKNNTVEYLRSAVLTWLPPFMTYEWPRTYDTLIRCNYIVFVASDDPPIVGQCWTQAQKHSSIMVKVADS